MTFVSLSLITTWMVLLVLGVTLFGLVHLLLLCAGAIVFVTGNHGRFHKRIPQAPVTTDVIARS
jgi:hypothetical protein